MKTASQSYGSLYGQINSDWFDDLEITEMTDFTNSKENTKLIFDFDPLAFVLSAHDQKFHNSQVHQYLENNILDPANKELRNQILQKISSYEDASINIQKYYQNRLLMRRLKGLSFSPFQQTLEQMLINIREIDISCLKILLILNDFYVEDCATDQLFKNYSSIKEQAKTHVLNDTFFFVRTINRNSKKSNSKRYYFSNSNNNLLVIECKINTIENNLLDYVSRQPRILIRGNCSIYHQPGREDFLLYKNGDFKFFDPTASNGK